MPDYFRVKEPFAYGNDVATVGQIWADDNPAFKGREQFFERVEAAAARTETASAAPGEVRSVFRKKPAKKAAPTPVPAAQTESEL